MADLESESDRESKPAAAAPRAKTAAALAIEVSCNADVGAEVVFIPAWCNNGVVDRALELKLKDQGGVESDELQMVQQQVQVQKLERAQERGQVQMQLDHRHSQASSR
eukprot:scaffold18896_cov44-Tisochrysis_lutea.AAC.1